MIKTLLLNTKTCCINIFKSIVLLLTYAIDKDFFSKNGVNFQDN